MGGRGSSGGGTGGGHGPNYAANAKMPGLTGSEKQKKWASDIRDTALKSADLVVKNSKKLGTSLSSRNLPSVEGAEFARNVAVKELQSVSSASKIIDKRTKLSYDGINKIALEYDRIYRKGRYAKL